MRDVSCFDLRFSGYTSNFVVEEFGKMQSIVIGTWLIEGMQARLLPWYKLQRLARVRCCMGREGMRLNKRWGPAALSYK